MARRERSASRVMCWYCRGGTTGAEVHGSWAAGCGLQAAAGGAEACATWVLGATAAATVPSSCQQAGRPARRPGWEQAHKRAHTGTGACRTCALSLSAASAIIWASLKGGM